MQHIVQEETDNFTEQSKVNIFIKYPQMWLK